LSWIQSPLGAFDLETTGRDPLAARIVTGCLIRPPGDRLNAQNWLLDPGVDIPDGAVQVHGVTTERARAEGQDYSDGYREIRNQLETAWASGEILAIYNAVYDMTVIDAEGRRLGYAPLVVGPVIDPYVIDREVDKYRKGKRILSVTCTHYGVQLDDAHTADGDAFATLRLAIALAHRFPGELEHLTTADLMAAQPQWHKTRQDGFAAYLARTGQDASSVSGDWPLRTVS